MTSLDTTAVALREDEILVRLEYMIEDPLDWTSVDTVTQEYSHSTHGCDFSGIVVQLGSAQTPHEHGIHLGDHVVGFIRSTALQRVIHADTNARYIRLAGELAWKVPRGTFTHEQAAKRRLGRFRYMFGAVSR
ncbi:hypothetical protein BXZ70DRAFT_38134 [Cristinia sonorae]|uniref:Alcohol dehydrogenase-like N-terminal domain-containing protein n=1 Tax=Cristinia sonorae TaxID=1940300 RepID=A0A8K0XV00_9AGAR|nr:hypothetical protein BXZ70DRAFT_38134 [Cristinia sonorae]